MGFITLSQKNLCLPLENLLSLPWPKGKLFQLPPLFLGSFSVFPPRSLKKSFRKRTKQHKTFIQTILRSRVNDYRRGIEWISFIERDLNKYTWKRILDNYEFIVDSQNHYKCSCKSSVSLGISGLYKILLMSFLAWAHLSIEPGSDLYFNFKLSSFRAFRTPRLRTFDFYTKFWW